MLHITFAFYPYLNLGGVPRAVYDLVRLQRKRYNVTVITNKIDESGSSDLRDVKVIYLKNLSRRFIYRYQLYTPLPESNIFSAIKKSDIIHFHGHRNLLNDMVFYISRIFNKPYIITTHGTVHIYESKRILKKLYDNLTGDRFIREAEFIVAHSEIEKRQLVSSGLNDKNIRIIPNGIFFKDFENISGNTSFFEKYNIDKDCKIILFLGKITRRKGLEVAIDAFRRIRDNNLRLVIAGEVLGKLPDKMKMDRRVVYIGHLGHKDKISAILSSELLLYPSVYEAFGYVPFEALYLNRPCITGDDFGTSEHLSNVIPELVVSYGDSIELSQLIVKLLEDREMRSEIVKRGREYVVSQFSAERMADEYGELYRDILSVRND
ncbi:MAG: glycosyltransferase family 4 protein [Deltaproteobacteria bacterium]|nr:glycosyltransferase family 4 protein [Deltaproteobacteria bacterium]